ncbi:MAG: FAD-binding oxidoreductase [Candidatus Riflebacteria bacterium]|nr:FAD-binding oxidoreductase [Candidatus Riflebacteria bacterium]
MQFILTILLINAFVLLLCVFLVITNYLLNQSGKVKLTINNKQENEVERGQTLLSACFESGVFLPAACGGKGTCRKCALKVHSGGGKLTTFERIQLTKEDAQENVRLACQVKVRENLNIEVDKKAASAAAFKAKLIRSEAISPKIKILEFECGKGGLPSFEPGQYVQVRIPQPWETVLRSYSISSAPGNKLSFTLDVQAVEGGLVSNMLHHTPVGSELEFCGPFGEMHLPKDYLKSDDKPGVVLIAGGVGLAPMRSIAAALTENSNGGEIMLFHGAASRSGLYMEKHYRDLEKVYKNFKYFPALSAPLLEDGWVGFEGMVHQLLNAKLEGGANKICMLCGPKPMMKACEKILFNKGFSSDRIYSDPFDF